MTAETYSVSLRADDRPVSSTSGIRSWQRAADLYTEAMQRAHAIVEGPTVNPGGVIPERDRAVVILSDDTGRTLMRHEARRYRGEHVHRFTERVEGHILTVYRCECGSTTR